jgi:hypothetical protein
VQKHHGQGSEIQRAGLYGHHQGGRNADMPAEGMSSFTSAHIVMVTFMLSAKRSAAAQSMASWAVHLCDGRGLGGRHACDAMLCKDVTEEELVAGLELGASLKYAAIGAHGRKGKGRWGMSRNTARKTK